MKIIRMLTMLLLMVLVIGAKSKKDINSSQETPCAFEDKPLFGKVKLVEYASEADVKVKIVNSFPDLKVRFVESFADDCGEWQIVESGEDLRVFITESFPDIKIQPVTSFPGMQR